MDGSERARGQGTKALFLVPLVLPDKQEGLGGQQMDGAEHGDAEGGQGRAKNVEMGVRAWRLAGKYRSWVESGVSE